MVLNDIILTSLGIVVFLVSLFFVGGYLFSKFGKEER